MTGTEVSLTRDASVKCDPKVVANQKTVPVVVYTGAVDCVEAVVVARTYFAEALHNTRGPEGS